MDDEVSPLLGEVAHKRGVFHITYTRRERTHPQREGQRERNAFLRDLRRAILFL